MLFYRTISSGLYQFTSEMPLIKITIEMHRFFVHISTQSNEKCLAHIYAQKKIDKDLRKESNQRINCSITELINQTIN